MTEGFEAGHRRVTFGGGQRPSCGIGGCRRVGELSAGLEGNDFGRVGQRGMRDD